MQRQVPDELTVVVDGEALVDDGVAAVMYNVCRVRWQATQNFVARRLLVTKQFP